MLCEKRTIHRVINLLEVTFAFLVTYVNAARKEDKNSDREYVTKDDVLRMHP